jgi:multidrug efflux pump subunit AcrA (membrane-fusion protein)
MTSVARESELKGLLSAEQERVRQLEQATLTNRAELEATRATLAETTKSSEQRLAALRAELEALRNAAKGELEAQQAAAKAEREAQQAAARNEREAQQAAAKAEREAQQATIDELRRQLDKVNSSLNERNSLIERFETEMQSSSQVLGSIQHNLQHLGDVEPTRMLVRTQGETGIVHMLSRRTTLGRTPDNDIRIDEDFISRHHAVLLLSGITTIVEDLNSTNGTYVNGEPVNRRTLKEGDLVTLGKTEFRFVVKKAADKPA